MGNTLHPVTEVEAEFVKRYYRLLKDMKLIKEKREEARCRLKEDLNYERTYHHKLLDQFFDTKEYFESLLKDRDTLEKEDIFTSIQSGLQYPSSKIQLVGDVEDAKLQVVLTGNIKIDNALFCWSRMHGAFIVDQETSKDMEVVKHG